MKKISIIIFMILPLLSYGKEIEISDNAVKNYEIETYITDSKNVTLPRSALVVSRDNYFIYIKDRNFFEEIQVYPVKVTKDVVVLKFDTVKEREFVTKGSPYLRIVFLNDTDSEAE